MNLRNISAWSIQNPVVPIVIFAGLLFAGLVSFMRMDVVDQPNVEFPFVITQISQPGAAPSEIENQITQRVEAAIRGVNGVKNISSTAREGSSQTAAEFEMGIDVNEAVNEVKAAIDQIRGDLPDGILEPRVWKEETSAEPIGRFSVSAPDMTLEQLSWFVDDTVAKRLLAIDGMANVERWGGVDREIRVTLDPARMQALGVTASQINQVLRQININSGGGKAEIAGSRQSVRVLGNAQNASELAQLAIPLGNGRTIRLDEVATVKDSNSERVRISTINGKESVNFAISRTKTASDVTVYDEALKVFDQLKTENPGLQFTALSNSVQYTRDQYSSTIAAMVEGSVLAVFIVFLFLRDWRATLISALAIPLSAIPTFWFMDLMGFNLNSMALLGLSLVAGVLVDDAIVEIENIVRHMRMGKSAYQASIDAADEIGLAVVATTFSIVAVFLPVGLMPGIPGQFFKNFGFTVVVAVLMSLAVARMITPMIAAYFLKAHGAQSHGEGRLMDIYMKVLRWTMDDGKSRHLLTTANGSTYSDEGKVRGFFRRVWARLFDHRLWMLCCGMLAVVMTGVLLVTVPQQFQPAINEDSVQAQIEMVPGTTMAQTRQVGERVEKILLAQPEVTQAMIVTSEGSGFVRANLSEDRKVTSEEFKRRLQPMLANLPDARVSFRSGGFGGGGSGRAISIMLSGSNPELLKATANKVVAEMSQIKLIEAPRVKADLNRPEIIVKPRPELAAALGVTTSALSQTIRIATLGDIDQNSAKFSLADRQIPIRVMLPENARRDLSVIANLPVATSTGSSVPLSRVAEISFGAGPTTIERYNQARRVYIGADLAPDVVKGDAMKAINELPTMKNLPQGVSNTLAGEDQIQAEFVGSFLIAVVSGLLLVFAVLVLLYHRFIAPLVNMSSLFMAPLGGLLAIWLIGQPISMPVYIGLLMLIGIVGKNSILLIDFAIEEMAAGVPKKEAIIDAGHKRAQPIVMTTVAMVAGMVPTALSISGDGAWRAPMGTTVIGGLIVSTVLTLVIVPAAFSLADGVEKRFGRFFGKRLLSEYDPDKKRESRIHGGLPPVAPQPAE